MDKVEGVYLLIRDGVVLYVGQSNNINKRLLSHHFGFGCDIKVIRTTNYTERLRLERKLIRYFNPLFNTLGESNQMSYVTIDDVMRLPNSRGKLGSGHGKPCTICGRSTRINNVTGVCAQCQRHGLNHLEIRT